MSKVNARLSQIAEQVDGKVANVGWFPSAQYEDGTPVAYVALIQEKGAPEVGIPPRPTLGPTFEQKRDEWQKTIADGMCAVVRGQASGDTVLEAVGMQAAGDIKQAISTLSAPPLSPVTVLLRKWKKAGKKITRATVGEAAAAIAAGEDPGGDDKPLNATGLMLATLTNTVDKR
jgi:hypothetical protein